MDRSCFSLPSRYFFHCRDVGLPRMMVHPTAGIFRQPHANPPLFHLDIASRNEVDSNIHLQKDGPKPVIGVHSPLLPDLG